MNRRLIIVVALKRPLCEGRATHLSVWKSTGSNRLSWSSFSRQGKPSVLNYQGYFVSWSCLFSRRFQRLLYRPGKRFYYTIFYSGNRVDIEKKQKYNRLKKTAICQQKVADAILFGFYFISDSIVIYFMLVLSVRQWFLTFSTQFPILQLLI